MFDKNTFVSRVIADDRRELIVKLLGNVEGLPVLPVSTKLDYFEDLNGEEGNFMEALIGDVKESSKLLLDMIQVTAQINNKKSKIVKLNIEKNKISSIELILNKETYTFTIDELEKKGNLLIEEAIIDNFYKVSQEKNRNFRNKEDFINNYKIAKSKKGYKNKDGSTNDYHEFLGNGQKEFHTNEIYKSYLEVCEKERTNNTKILSVSKDNIKRMVNETSATIMEKAEHTVIFPLDDIYLEIYKDEETYMKLHYMLISKQNKYIKEMEIDLTVSTGKGAKVEQVKKIIDLYEQLNNQNLALKEKVVLKFRKLGKHKAYGMFIPGSDKRIPIVAIDVKAPGSVIHEFGHAVDNEIEDIPELKDVRNSIISYFRDKMDPELLGNKAGYYMSSKEIVARLTELGHDIKYPKDEIENKINLSKSREVYEENKEIYFNYVDMTKKEKEMIVSFYDMFFENSLDINQKTELGKGLVLQTKEVEEGRVKRYRERSEAEINKSKLKTILRGYTPEVVALLLDNNKKKEETGEELYLDQVGLLTNFMKYSSENLLNKFNNKNRLYNLDFQTLLLDNKKSMEIISKHINLLSNEEIIDLLGRTNEVDLTNFIKLNSDSKNVQNLLEEARAGISHVFSKITEERMKELYESPKFIEIITNDIEKKNKGDEMNHFMEALDYSNYRLKKQKAIIPKIEKEDFFKKITKLGGQINNHNQGIGGYITYFTEIKLRKVSNLIKKSNEINTTDSNDAFKKYLKNLLELEMNYLYENYEEARVAAGIDTVITFKEYLDINKVGTISNTLSGLLDVNNPLQNKEEVLERLDPVDLTKKQDKGELKLDENLALKLKKSISLLIKKSIPNEKVRLKFINEALETGVMHIKDEDITLDNLSHVKIIFNIVMEINEEIEFIDDLIDQKKENGMYGIFEGEMDYFRQVIAEDFKYTSEILHENIETYKEDLQEDMIEGSELEDKIKEFSKNELDELGLSEKEYFNNLLKEDNLEGLKELYKKDMNNLITLISNNEIMDLINKTENNIISKKEERINNGNPIQP